MKTIALMATLAAAPNMIEPPAKSEPEISPGGSQLMFEADCSMLQPGKTFDDLRPAMKESMGADRVFKGQLMTGNYIAIYLRPDGAWAAVFMVPDERVMCMMPPGYKGRAD